MFNPVSQSWRSYIDVFMRVPFHPFIIMWFITAYLHSVYKLCQKDLISKEFMRGRVSRWGHVEGGTVDYETSVTHLARTVTSFVKWRPTSDLCTSDETEETPLFRNGSRQEIVNEPNTHSSSEENWQIQCSFCVLRHDVHNDTSRKSCKHFPSFCIYNTKVKKFQALNFEVLNLSFASSALSLSHHLPSPLLL